MLIAFKDDKDGLYMTEVEDENDMPEWAKNMKRCPVPPAAQPTPQQLEAQFTAVIQQRLDDFARQRNYDGILSACTYATSTVAKFKAEGQACVNLRDATWSAAYDILAQVQAGTRPMPQSIADIEADLPPLVWPS